jgi:hypothetical protein
LLAHFTIFYAFRGDACKGSEETCLTTSNGTIWEQTSQKTDGTNLQKLDHLGELSSNGGNKSLKYVKYG